MKGVTTSYCRSINYGTPTPVWAAREWIGPYEKSTELWGYWKNAQLLDTGSAEIKGTFHVRRGERILLSMLNLDRKAIEVPVRLDLKALGFTGKVYAYDPFLREEITLQGDTFKLAFTPEGIRLIQIAAKPINDFVPEKVGANLLAELTNGVPAGWVANQYVDQNNLQKPKPEELLIENGTVVIQGRGDNIVGLRKNGAASGKGKPYMLEAEVHVDAGNGSFLATDVDAGFFWISCSMTSSHNHDFRFYRNRI